MSTLYIVSTPIGNLGDITYRAVEVLKSVDLIACEDTRVSSKLLVKYQIDKPLVAVNDFNESSKIVQILSILREGKNVALISDAGTPLISDPGYKIVREAIGSGFKVESIPGPSAALAALTVSGLPSDKFTFCGYLPKKDGKRKSVLKSVKKNVETVKSTSIFYESPYRIVKTLEDIKNVFGDVDIVICRELTKLHEEVRREKISQSIEHFSRTLPKGEFVILI